MIMLLADRDRTFFRELCEHHVSGQLKVAPEHVADEVLEKMGKPEHKVYEEFAQDLRGHEPKAWKKAVSGSLSDVFPSRLGL